MTAARDAASWAKSVARLNVADVPAGAVNLNVEGRRLASPIQGFGRMWQKTYQVRVPAGRASATELIATWKRHFPDFRPDGNRFYAPLTGIQPGEVALLNMALPGRLTLSTGVMVLYADEESFTLMTPQGDATALSPTERPDRPGRPASHLGTTSAIAVDWENRESSVGPNVVSRRARYDDSSRLPAPATHPERPRPTSSCRGE